MKKIAHFVVKFRKLILVIAVALLIPSLFGAAATKINYDILTYLPSDLDSMVGETYLEDDFHLASTAIITVEDMPTAQLMDLKQRISEVNGVRKTFWISDVLDESVSPSVLPDDLYDAMFNNDKDATMMIVTFDDIASSQQTMHALAKIKVICQGEAYIGGMSIILQDTKAIVDQEMPYYILIAVGACLVVLWLALKNNVVPFLFMLGLLFPILYNFGTNIIFGQISYITEALATVLQLGVTMDYSIFLLSRYQEEQNWCKDDFEAMEHAIRNTATSISASSLTTIAGFIALCVMRLTLGRDIGLVMAKGVVLGLISTVTILPSLLLCFRRVIKRHTHRTVIPKLVKVSNYVPKHYKKITAIFCAIFFVFCLAYPKVQNYYTLTDSLPDTMTGKIGTNKMKEDFGMTSSIFVIVDDNMKSDQVKSLEKDMRNVEGVKSVLGIDDLVDAEIPGDMLPSDLTDVFETDGKKLIMVTSSYKAGTDDASTQITDLIKIVKSYDDSGVITGEAPMTKDLIEIANVDFQTVNWVSIALLFLIIAISFKSFTIPIMLVASIESAIIINMAIPYFTGTVVPFIASIVIGTIQLGATVDYAILMTTRFEEEERRGHNKFEAAQISIENCSQSIMTSGLTFFAATVGVAFVSKMELLSSICLMIARGALISMVVIIFVLPCLLIIFEPIIRKTTVGWAQKKGKKKEVKKAAAEEAKA